jgi:hypothetical protein
MAPRVGRARIPENRLFESRISRRFGASYASFDLLLIFLINLFNLVKSKTTL